MFFKKLKLSLFSIIFLLYEVKTEQAFSKAVSMENVQKLLKECAMSTNKQIMVVADSDLDNTITFVTELQTPYILIQVGENSGCRFQFEKYPLSSNIFNLIVKNNKSMVVIFLTNKITVFELFSQINGSEKRRRLSQHIFIFFTEDEIKLDSFKEITHFEDFNLIFIKLNSQLNHSSNIEILTFGTETLYFSKLHHAIQKTLKQPIVWKRQQYTLKKKVLSVPILNEKLYLELKIHPNQSIQLTGGYLERLIKALEKKFDLKLNFFVPNVTFPSDKMNGTWTGFLSLFHRQEADITFHPIGMMESRLDAADFSRPYGFNSFRITSVVPGFRSKTSVVFRSYKTLTWLSIIISILVIGTVLTLIIRIKNSVFCEIHPRSPDLRYSSTFWKLFRILLLQDTDVSNVIKPLPFLLSLWGAIALVLTNGYQGQLVSLMAVPSKRTPIDTMREFDQKLEMGKVEFLSSKDNFFLQYLKSSKNDLIQRIWRNVKDKKKLLEYTSNAESLKDLNRNRVAIFGSVEIVLSLAKESNINEDLLYFSKEAPLYVLSGIFLRPSFPFRKEIDQTIQQFLESGLYEKWKQDKVGRHPPPKQIINPIVRLEYLQGAFIIYFIGTSISVIVFIMELQFSRIGRRLNHQ